MSIAEQHNVPAAWYPDQNVPGQLRWWDGRDWTLDVRPIEAPAAPAVATETPLLETRRGLHAVAKPAQGFGHATPEQLRTWPAPQASDRSDVDVPVSQTPREWANNDSVGAIKGWMSKAAAEPVHFVPDLTGSRNAASAAVEDLSYSLTEEPTDYFAEGPIEATHPRVEHFEALTDLNDWQPAAPGFVPEPVDAVHAPETPTQQATAEPEQPVYRGLSAVPPFEDVVAAAAASPAQSPTEQWIEWPLSAGDPALPAPVHTQAATPAAVPAAAAQQPAVALTRRQLRELVGPLTVGEAD